MKKSLLLISIPAILALVACSPETSNVSSSSKEESSSSIESSLSSSSKEESSSSAESSSSSSATVSSEQSSQPSSEEAVKEYKIVIVAGEGSNVSIEGGKTSFLPGDEVTVAISVDDDHLLEDVLLDGRSQLLDGEGKLHLVIPNRDVEIETKTKARGDIAVTSVSTVDEDALPTDVASLKTMLEKAEEAEGKYLASVEVEALLDDTYSQALTTVYSNDVVVEDINTAESYSSHTDHSRVEKGIDGSYYYELSSSNALGEQRTNIAVTPIGSGEDEMSADAAEKNVTVPGVAASIVDAYFEGDYNYDIISDEKGDNRFNLAGAMASSVSQDKKSVTVSFEATNNSYLGYKTMSFSVTFDGDYFLSGADIEIATYSTSDYSSETGLDPEAVPESNEYIHLESVRDYRDEFEDKAVLSDYAMSDYDVEISYKQDEESGSHPMEENTVEASSVLSFVYLSKDANSYLIYPSFVGAKEEGMVDPETGRVLKEGEMTLLFDNGLGEIKEIKVTAVQPKPLKVSISADSTSGYVNEPLSFAAAVLPEAANQDIDVEIDSDNSTGEGTIATNGDGTYSLTATKAGTIRVVATSKLDGSKTAYLDFTFIEKPNYDAVYETMTTMTMAGESGYDSVKINFNGDGTGTCVYNYFGFTDYKSTFEWSIDKETLAVTISNVDGDCDFKSYTVTGNSKAEAVLNHFDDVTFALSPIAREEL